LVSSPRRPLHCQCHCKSYRSLVRHDPELGFARVKISVSGSDVPSSTGLKGQKWSLGELSYSRTGSVVRFVCRSRARTWPPFRVDAIGSVDSFFCRPQGPDNIGPAKSREMNAVPQAEGREAKAGSRVTKLAAPKRVPGIALLRIFRLHEYFLLCNKFSSPLLLLTLLGLIAPVFNMVAVLVLLACTGRQFCHPRGCQVQKSRAESSSQLPCRTT
jgi:hypothetical protein